MQAEKRTLQMANKNTIFSKNNYTEIQQNALIACQRHYSFLGKNCIYNLRTFFHFKKSG